MKVAFVHPDLGIGGAERLVIDAAVGLQKLGHSVVIYTSYRNVEHCFDEARDGTLEVRIRGDTMFPSSLFGRFAILCAIMRQLHLAITLIQDTDSYDVIFIDQLSAAIPLLKFFRESTRVLFYCHFPDKLLSQRTSLLKAAYRLPFDFIEGWTTGHADTIVVNSDFTASVFHEAFPSIKKQPKVVYPCVDTHQTFSVSELSTDRRIVLSINRFERKKNMELVIHAFANLSTSVHYQTAILVVAGGYDSRVKENFDYHRELQQLCTSLHLEHQTLQAPYSSPVTFDTRSNVVFLLSIPGELKNSLLAGSTLLAYTPEREHFGIVPIEASLAGLPVIAQDNGGPRETVQDGISGFLRPADSGEWSKVLGMVLFEMSDADRQNMGKKGRQRVLETFSQETMSTTLSETLEEMTRRPETSSNKYAMVLLAVFLISLWKWALRPIVVPLVAKIFGMA